MVSSLLLHTFSNILLGDPAAEDDVPEGLAEVGVEYVVFVFVFVSVFIFVFVIDR